MSYLRFEDAGASKSGKTKVWVVRSVASGDALGDIYWWAQWRKYVFQPRMFTHYDTACLREIAAFVEQATGEIMRPRKPSPFKTPEPGQPCWHQGCLSHVSHPCEGCGRIAGQPLTHAKV